MWKIIGFGDGSHEFSPPCYPNAEQIDFAESALGLIFPPDFRSFLQSQSVVTVPGAAIFFWVGSVENNIIDVNHRLRQSCSSIDPFSGHEQTMPPALSDHLIAFYTDGNGNFVCFDLNNLINEWPSICFVDHERFGEPPTSIADSFGDWFAQFLHPGS